jgi:DNA-binding transcriptional ArsR family regulator
VVQTTRSGEQFDELLDLARRLIQHLNKYSTVEHHMPKTHPLATDARAGELADRFRLMGDASRLRIIFACMGEPISSGAIATGLELSPSLVSHHLRLLRATRILEAHRQGKQVFYVVADEHIRRIIAGMLDHLDETSHSRK